jgi:hypothetical protein
MRFGAIVGKLVVIMALGSCAAVIAPRVYPFDRCGEVGAAPCPDLSLENAYGSVGSRARYCRNAGYLCAGGGEFQVMRWCLCRGVLRVRVPLPDWLPEREAQKMRTAAVAGILEWNGRPFRLDVDSARIPTRRWDVELIWTRTLGGGPAGIAHLSYGDSTVATEFRVIAIAVFTQAPWDRSITWGPSMIQSISAHEMGHALGLGHSDDPNDLMYPEQRPVMRGQERYARGLRVSARDRQTVDALYRVPAGAWLR